MKNIQIACICIGIFLCFPTLQGSALLDMGEDLGKAAAKGTKKTWAEWLGGYANTAFDMGMPMGVGMAASNANQFLSQEQEAVWADFALETTSITAALNSWSAQQGELMQRQMNTVSQYFTSQLQTITSSQKNIQAAAQAEANYLFQNLSLQQPATSLISKDYAGEFDQFFATGIMATPSSNFTWYNYHVSGDWLYDPISASFWQNQAVPFSSSPNTPFNTQSPDPATVNVLSSNNIFVEYYPSQKPYTIAGTFTIYAITFPFFVGVMFNKNRWISGNMDGMDKGRLLGIYATSATSAGIYFAEQYELSQADAQTENQKNPTPIKIPLLQIINGHVNSLAPIAEANITAINTEPITFHFKITTNPTTASCKIWAATDKEPAQAFLIQNLDSSFYIYHSLGFMSPGAATEWKLTAPQELTFSPQAILSFKNTVFPPKH